MEIKKLKDGIYEEVCKVVDENYSCDLWNMLENEGIEVQSLYIVDPLKFLDDKDFDIYIDTSKVNVTFNVKDTFENTDVTVENILKQIKEEEKKKGY